MTVRRRDEEGTRRSLNHVGRRRFIRARGEEIGPNHRNGARIHPVAADAVCSAVHAPTPFVSFLNPLALLGLVAVAAPLLLHVFTLQQPKTVDFSSLAFVKEIQESAVRRVRIKEWLLLALRMLAIACLVLAFSRPTLTGDLASLAGQARTAHGLVVDNSLSMGVDATQGGSALDQARRRLQGPIDFAGEDDDIAVQPVSASPIGDETTTVYASPQGASETLSSLSPKTGADRLAPTISRAAERIDTSSAPRKVVYAASDLQESTLGTAENVELPDDIEVRLLPIDRQTPSNVGVTDVSVKSRIVQSEQPLEMEATLVNHGTDPLTNYVASVYLDDQRVAQTTVTLKPGVETSASFTVTPTDRGWLTGAVTTEDDGFPPDDRHHFALNVPEVRRVLVVRGSDQETRYVDLALSSEVSADRVAFQRTSIREQDLSSTDLNPYDAVLLVGPRTLSGASIDAIARFVDRGGGVLLFPNREARLEDYNTLLDTLEAGRVDTFLGSPDTQQNVASFGQVDLEHPLFEGVFEQSDRSDDAEIEQPDIYFALKFRASGRGGQTLIELTNGTPFLHEVRHGNGRLLISAVAPSLAWSDLPTQGLFVPLLYRSIYYLSASAPPLGPQLLAGRPGEVRIPGITPDASLRLTGPGGTNLIPDQRALFGATVLQVGSNLQTAGVYDIETENRIVRRLAVNVDPAESNLRTSPPDSAASALEAALDAPVEVLRGSGAGDLADTLRTREAGTEIWNLFLLLALAFLVAEMLVSSQWRPETTAT